MRRLRGILVLVLAAVFVLGAARLARYGLEQYSARTAARQAARTAGLESTGTELTEPQVPLAQDPEVAEPVTVEPELDPEAAFLRDLDLAALQQTNPEVLGWICIPGTQLSYPYLQTEDNQYYLSHTWEKQKNAAGSVFLECKVSGDLSDFNTIIYGHNMKNGSIFGSLRQYRKQSHFEAYPSFYLADAQGIRRYDIFAALEAQVVGPTYRLKVEQAQGKQAVLDYSVQRSVIQTDIVPTVEDSIVTLSTCTGNGYDTRWVVQGVLAERYDH